ncbi:hypothetical protein FB446DRAFT_389121 [Lentinula raphanica]|nr:hypothetical protein FB446DRAFT_389121 [Lentinula raphanica]
MHIVSDFLFLLFVLVQLVFGAPIRIKRNLDEYSGFLADPTISGTELELSPIDTNPDSHSLSITISTGDWDNPNDDSDPPFPSALEVPSSPIDDLGYNGLQQISHENDGTFFSSVATTPDMPHSTDLSLYTRNAIDTASKDMDTVGSVMDKVSKYADSIPEVGEILGPALQVVTWCVKLVSKLLHGISQAEHESAEKRSGFRCIVICKIL